MKVKTILSRLINGTDIELFLQEEDLDLYNYTDVTKAVKQSEATSNRLRSQGEIPTIGVLGDDDPDAYYVAPCNMTREYATSFTFNGECYVIGETGMMTTYSNLIRDNTKGIADQFDKLFANTGVPTNMYNTNTISDIIKSMVNKHNAYKLQNNYYAYYCNTGKELEGFRFMMANPTRCITERFADELGAQGDKIVLTDERLDEMRKDTVRYQHMIKNSELMLTHIKNNFSGQRKNKYMLRLFADMVRANGDVRYYTRRVFGDSSTMVQYAEEGDNHSTYSHYPERAAVILKKYGEESLADLYGAQVYFEDVHNSLATIKKYTIVKDMGMEFKGTVM